ncbi:hypothetical protein [Pampinifervens florentissimum]|uniref:hypothetical protein n=1 Tax=Pampinifervens florentissimum TaxID=1632019 RepID=UPI0020C5A917|nr:hypothetical protein [Hydrogenobacter sp. T-8]
MKKFLLSATLLALPLVSLYAQHRHDTQSQQVKPGMMMPMMPMMMEDPEMYKMMMEHMQRCRQQMMDMMMENPKFMERMMHMMLQHKDVMKKVLEKNHEMKRQMEEILK